MDADNLNLLTDVEKLLERLAYECALRKKIKKELRHASALELLNRRRHDFAQAALEEAEQRIKELERLEQWRRDGR